MRPKKVILCIDDNEQALSVRKFLLETRGYRVVCAMNAEDAVARYREGGLDLVICDLVMPNVDGAELVRRLKEINPEVPAMLISGAVKQLDAENSADTFLPKGANSPVEMLERIRVMVARKRGPRKQVARVLPAEVAPTGTDVVAPPRVGMPPHAVRGRSAVAG